MSKIKFFKSHELLLQEKLKAVTQASLMLVHTREDFQNSLNIIAVELGIPETELDEWRITKDQKSIEKKPKKEKKKIEGVKKKETF